MNTFLTDIQKRRSIYGLSAESTLSDQELQSLVETAVRHAPSAFNSQSSRVVLLTGAGVALLAAVLTAAVPQSRRARLAKVDADATSSVRV